MREDAGVEGGKLGEYQIIHTTELKTEDPGW